MRLLKKENRLVVGIVGVFALLLIAGIVDAQKSDKAAAPETTSSPRPATSPTPRTSPSPSPSATELSKKEKAKLRAERRREKRRELAQRERLRAERAEASAALLSTSQALVSYYNAEDFIHASGYVARRFIQKCGGDTDLAFAFAQNKNMERLTYEIHKVEVTALDASRAQADVTYSARDDETGELWDDHFKNGLTFANEGGWVLDDLFPLGVGSFC